MVRHAIEVTKKGVIGSYRFIGEGTTKEEARQNAYEKLSMFNLDPNDPDVTIKDPA